MSANVDYQSLYESEKIKNLKLVNKNIKLANQNNELANQNNKLAKKLEKYETIILRKLETMETWRNT